jgi:hypothetical protein
VYIKRSNNSIYEYVWIVTYKAIPLQAWTGPLRVPGGRGSQISRQSAHECCQPYAPAAFSCQAIFLALISVRG